MEKIRVENFEDIHTHTHTCYLKKKGKNEKAITLIALVIAIAILIILAGVVIVALGGENGLLTQEKQEKQAATEEYDQMYNALLGAINVLKEENGTFDDLTQEWLDERLKNYKCIIRDYASVEELLTAKEEQRDVVYEKKVSMCHKAEYNSKVYEFLIDDNLRVFNFQDSRILNYSVDSIRLDVVDLKVEIEKNNINGNTIVCGELYSLDHIEVVCPSGNSKVFYLR